MTIIAGHGRLAAGVRPSRASALPVEVFEAARAAAASVDADARFPHEAFAALKAHGLLGTLIPQALGGPGATLREAAAQCQALAACCSSAGMILAMHHIQVACLVGHASAGWTAAFLRRVHKDQLLLGSSTSEAGVGGDIRSSLCAVVRDGRQISITKQASAISYGLEADALLVTARAHPDAPAADQVLVVFERDGLALRQRSAWDAMGMRGTGSHAFTLKGVGGIEQILRAPFGEVAAATMIPVSHTLWGAVWTGIAGDAVGRARNALRARRKLKDDCLPSGAVRLAEAVERLQMAEARVRQALDSFDRDGGSAPSFALAASDNGLKTGVADACVQVVQDALQVCGFEGYATSGPFSVSRHLRDLMSAPLMIGNGRMRESAARLLLAQRPLLGLS